MWIETMRATVHTVLSQATLCWQSSWLLRLRPNAKVCAGTTEPTVTGGRGGAARSADLRGLEGLLRACVCETYGCTSQKRHYSGCLFVYLLNSERSRARGRAPNFSPARHSGHIWPWGQTARVSPRFLSEQARKSAAARHVSGKSHGPAAKDAKVKTGIAN